MQDLNETCLTMVVGKDAAQTPSRLSVRSSIPDATTYEQMFRKAKNHIPKHGIEIE